MPGSSADRREKTSAMSVTSSSGENRAVTFDTSEEDKTRRDIEFCDQIGKQGDWRRGARLAWWTSAVKERRCLKAVS